MLQLIGGWVFQIHGLGWQSAMSGATRKVWDCFKDSDIWLKEAKNPASPQANSPSQIPKTQMLFSFQWSVQTK